jgi:adenosylcobinamide-GDP ribazoletransferase
VRVRPLRDLALAIGFLTAIPVGREWPEGGAPEAVGFYAWVGFILGAEAWLVAWLLQLRGAGTALGLLAAAAIVTAWAITTRMLHWDGLGDTADGLWGAREPARRLEIMRDSRVGSFGATAIVLVALLEVAAVAAVLAARQPWVLVLAPVLGRGAASLAAWTLPPARTEGLGAATMCRPGAYAVLATALALLALLVLGHLAGAARLPFFATLGIGLVSAVVLPRILAKRVGGMTGDLLGATILGVEVIVLIAGAVLT